MSRYEDVGVIGEFPSTGGKTMKVRLVRDNENGQFFIDFRNCFSGDRFTKEGFRIKTGDIKEFHRLTSNILSAVEEVSK